MVTRVDVTIFFYGWFYTIYYKYIVKIIVLLQFFILFVGTLSCNIQQFIQYFRLVEIVDNKNNISNTK